MSQIPGASASGRSTHHIPLAALAQPGSRGLSRDPMRHGSMPNSVSIHPTRAWPGLVAWTTVTPCGGRSERACDSDADILMLHTRSWQLLCFLTSIDCFDSHTCTAQAMRSRGFSVGYLMSPIRRGTPRRAIPVPAPPSVATTAGGRGVGSQRRRAARMHAGRSPRVRPRVARHGSGAAASRVRRRQGRDPDRWHWSLIGRVRAGRAPTRKP